MIESLHISNYALIDSVELDLSRGLNIITGETGAGKSVMLKALSMLLGERCDTKSVTDKNRKSIIEAVVDVSTDSMVKSLLEENGLGSDDNICILRREILPSGRSRSFINDEPVNLDVLEKISRLLIDIHSQHQNLLLATPEFQLRIIDALAGTASDLIEYEKLYSTYKKCLREYAVKKKALEKIRDDEESIKGIINRIDKLALRPGILKELEAQKEILENHSNIKESLENIVSLMSGNDLSLVPSLKKVCDDSRRIEEFITDGKDLCERLDTVRIEIKDIAETFETIYSGIEENPGSLDAIEEKLNAIYTLQHKLRVDNVEGIIAEGVRLKESLDELKESESLLADLHERARVARSAAIELAKTISAKRRKEADEFAEVLCRKASPLGMKNLQVVCDFTYTKDLTPTGIDNLEFRFAFNKNQEPLPVGKTASGGEISRLMLCIKSIVARKMQFPTIIFDEVDTGVSGDIAGKMGEMMLEISDTIQVIAITHLAQVAAKGRIHFKVFKEDDQFATHTRLTKLTDEQRVDELALMLSGSAHVEEAKANARYLLNKTR